MRVGTMLSLAVLIWMSGCQRANFDVNRDYDDLEDERMAADNMSPDAFVERLGEPDEWRNEGTGDDLQMTAIWRCLDGKYREVVWVMDTSHVTGQSWRVVNDVHGPGDCQEEDDRYESP